MTKNKPLVVLAGWLGCQQRSLRRYEKLFANNGFQYISKIASPTMAAESCFRPLPPPPLRCHSQWPTQQFPKLEPSSSTQDFAWDLLREIHHRNSPYVVFYAFSNGGCFVWEQVRRILATAGDSSISHRKKEDIRDLQEEQHEVLESLRHKTAGVIFDSCPSRQLALMGAALAFCTWKERWEVATSYGIDVAFLPFLLAQNKKTTANLRSVAYYQGLKEDPWYIPQLYLYSQSDFLIPSDVVAELVNHRRKMIGSNLIFSHKWEKSRHCAHYMDHPDEYETTIKAFLEVCHPNSDITPRSKL